MPGASNAARPNIGCADAGGASAAPNIATRPPTRQRAIRSTTGHPLGNGPSACASGVHPVDALRSSAHPMPGASNYAGRVKCRQAQYRMCRQRRRIGGASFRISALSGVSAASSVLPPVCNLPEKRGAAVATVDTLGHSLKIPCLDAGIAQLVEHNLAKVGVASSSLVSRSRISINPVLLASPGFFLLSI